MAGPGDDGPWAAVRKVRSRAMSAGLPVDLVDALTRAVAAHEPELVALRRDLHAHPEVSRGEVRTTRLVRERLTAAGLQPSVLRPGTGLICDIGTGDPS